MPTPTLRLTTIRAIDVRMGPSWLLVAGAVAWTTQRTFASHDRTLAASVMLGLVVAVLITGSALLQELARALVSTRRGAEVGGVTLSVLGRRAALRRRGRRAADGFAIAVVGVWTGLVLAAAFGLGSMYAGRWGLEAVADVAGVLGWLNLALASVHVLRSAGAGLVRGRPAQRQTPGSAREPAAAPPRRRRGRGRAVLAGVVAVTMSLALVAWAALVVPMPFHEVQPGSAHAVEDLVVLSSAAGGVHGDLDLLTVRRTTPNILEVAWIGLHPDRELRPTVSRAPAGLDLETYVEVQRDAFRTSFLTAVALAAEQAGYTVEMETRAVVARVVQGGPSDGQLRPGDVITGINGAPVESADTLVERLGASDQPRPVALRVDRDGQPTEVTVDLRELPESDRPVLGIIVETVAEEPDLPFDAAFGDTNIIGPSAGLMLTLAATDLLLAEDLAAGRTIAGTGTIARDGTVGQVSSVELKTRAALAAGAELLLVPLEQVEDARAAVAAGVEVVGVTSLGDALDAVRRHRLGASAAHR